MILGRIIGKASTTNFQFSVTSSNAKKLQFIQIHHSDYGFVLGQITELERSNEEMIAKCNIIGYKDVDGRIKGIRTPFNIGTEILEAEDSFIKNVIELKQEGGFIGKLDGKNIPIKLNLQKVLTKHLSVLAKSGAGKSYCVSCLIEEIMEKNIPLLIIDPHGEYTSLKYENIEERDNLIAWGLSPKSYSSQIQEYGDPNNKEDLIPLKLNEHMNSYELMKMLPINLTNTQEAMLFSVVKDLNDINFDNILIGLEQLNSTGKWSLIDTIMYLRDLKLFSPSPTNLNDLVKPGKCTIINLKGISPEIQDLIVNKLMKDLFLARKKEKIPPFFCVLEEAHNFVPEKGFGKTKSSEVIRLISSEGRKFGLGLCVISQRPALVQKTVLAQCSTQIILKITNPNDLRAITSSIEGITSETANEIQNLPIGTGLVCGVVDKPLVVNIRPRRSKHGGVAVNILDSGNFKEKDSEEIVNCKNNSNNNVIQTKDNPNEYNKDIIEESKKFDENSLMSLIKPRLSIKDIKLIADKPINKITTYLIPSVFFECEINGIKINLLLDKIKGKIIVDPDKDIKHEISSVSLESNFFRKPTFETINYDVKIPEQLDNNLLKEKLSNYCKINDYRDCFIVYHKVEY